MDSHSLSRDELIVIVRRLCAAEGTEEEIDEMVRRLNAAMPRVPWTDFIYWPAGYPHPPSAHQPTPEEIVDRALAYKPRVIITPPPGGA